MLGEVSTVPGWPETWRKLSVRNPESQVAQHPMRPQPTSAWEQTCPQQWMLQRLQNSMNVVNHCSNPGVAQNQERKWDSVALDCTTVAAAVGTMWSWIACMSEPCSCRSGCATQLEGGPVRRYSVVKAGSWLSVEARPGRQ